LESYGKGKIARFYLITFHKEKDSHSIYLVQLELKTQSSLNLKPSLGYSSNEDKLRLETKTRLDLKADLT